MQCYIVKHEIFVCKLFSLYCDFAKFAKITCTRKFHAAKFRCSRKCDQIITDAVYEYLLLLQASIATMYYIPSSYQYQEQCTFDSNVV